MKLGFPLFGKFFSMGSTYTDLPSIFQMSQCSFSTQGLFINSVFVNSFVFSLTLFVFKCFVLSLISKVLLSFKDLVLLLQVDENFKVSGENYFYCVLITVQVYTNNSTYHLVICLSWAALRELLVLLRLFCIFVFIALFAVYLSQDSASNWHIVVAQ